MPYSCRSHCLLTQRKIREEQAKNTYLAALGELADEQSNANGRVKCLELGRVYYGFSDPDYDKWNSNRVITDSHNNSSAREAKIMSDIEVRVRNLKTVS